MSNTIYFECDEEFDFFKRLCIEFDKRSQTYNKGDTWGGPQNGWTEEIFFKYTDINKYFSTESLIWCDAIHIDEDKQTIMLAYRARGFNRYEYYYKADDGVLHYRIEEYVKVALK